MRLTITKIAEYKSRFGDTFFYIFMKREDGASCKTCIYKNYGNYNRWLPILSLLPGSIIEVAQKDLFKNRLVDADNFPKIIFSQPKIEPIENNIAKTI